LFLTVNSYAQKNPPTIISGKVTDGAGDKLTRLAVVINSRSGKSIVATKKGEFSISALQNDTILFLASGYTEKAICMRNEPYKVLYSITVKLDTKLASIDTVKPQSKDTVPKYDYYTYVVNDLYACFSRMDTLNKIPKQFIMVEQKQEALQKILGMYVNADISGMAYGEFFDFMGWLLAHEGRDLWTAGNKKLILDTKDIYLTYHPFSVSVTEPSPEQSFTMPVPSAPETDHIKGGHGAGMAVIFIYDLIKGLSSGTN
jgi:hypothetical protein